MIATPKLCECGCGEPAPIATRSDARRGVAKGEPRRFIAGHQSRGRRQSVETREKIARARRGRHHTAETRERISELARGRRHTAETRAKISRAIRGRHLGARHPHWRGDDVGYKCLHKWVARHKTKTGVCTKCGVAVGTARHTGTEWANVSGRYRRDLDDFIELCIPCHR